MGRGTTAQCGGQWERKFAWVVTHLLVPWGLLLLTPSFRKGGQSCTHFPFSLQNCSQDLCPKG